MCLSERWVRSSEGPWVRGPEPVFALFISRAQGVRKDAVLLSNVSSACKLAVAADAVKGRKGPERLSGAIALLAIALLSTVLLSTVALTVALAVLHHHRASQHRRPHEQLSFRRERAHDACRRQYGCREHGICETANHAGLLALHKHEAVQYSRSAEQHELNNTVLRASTGRLTCLSALSC